jgi:hypothetical protein
MQAQDTLIVVGTAGSLEGDARVLISARSAALFALVLGVVLAVMRQLGRRATDGAGACACGGDGGECCDGHGEGCDCGCRCSDDENRDVERGQAGPDGRHRAGSTEGDDDGDAQSSPSQGANVDDAAGIGREEGA